MKDTFLTVDQVALRLQTKPYTVRQWLRDGRLRGVKYRRAWRVPESALLEATAPSGVARLSKRKRLEKPDHERFTTFFDLASKLHRKLDGLGFGGVDGAEMVGVERDARMRSTGGKLFIGDYAKS